MVRKAGSSVITDRKMLNKNIYPFIGHLKITRIQPHHIDKLICEAKAKGLCNSTINRNLCVIKTIFNHCMRHRIIFYNPMTAIQSLRVDTKRYKYWSIRDAQTFIDYTRAKYSSNGHYAVFMVYLAALNTGMRQGELLALRWKDVDFENRLITVGRTYSCHERKFNDSTKSHKVRFVPLNDALYKILDDVSRGHAPNDLVFRQKGYMLDPHNLRSRYFEKDMQESGVERIRFHDLRHTYASHYMMNAGNPYDLQKILGHSTLRMTERYAHLSAAFLATRGNVVSFGGEDNVVHVKFGATG